MPEGFPRLRFDPNRILIDPFHRITQVGDSGGDRTRQFESTVNDVDGIATLIVVEPRDDGGALGAVGSVSIVEEHTGVNACRLPPQPLNLTVGVFCFACFRGSVVGFKRLFRGTTHENDPDGFFTGQSELVSGVFCGGVLLTKCLVRVGAPRVPKLWRGDGVVLVMPELLSVPVPHEKETTDVHVVPAQTA